jgi:acyl-CoA synthetase (AMP-forming)/AMP-acid ligase II
MPFFCYIGLGDDLVKGSSVWISPFEMDTHLQKHQKVKECAVLGVPERDGLFKTGQGKIDRRQLLEHNPQIR